MTQQEIDNEERKLQEKNPGLFPGTSKAAGIAPLKITKPAEVTAPTAPAPTATAPAAVPAKTTSAALRDIQNETTNAVLAHVQCLQEAGDLILPPNYAIGNQIKLAWLNILEVEDRSGHKALECCTRESIANSIMEMCVQGLSVTKKQCDFIVYAGKLTLQIEYHGTVALARRLGGVVGVPIGNVIYEGDVFKYEFDVKTGKKNILAHEQDFKNIDMNKIVGAYATLQLGDGSTYVEIMNINQIRQAWMQGATKGQSPAHKNFPDQMCIKTVIGRACKLFISTSDDAGLYAGVLDEPTDETKPVPKTEAPRTHHKTLQIEDAIGTDVTPKAPVQTTPVEKVTAAPAY